MTADTNLPFVSVIMPIRNEADFIARSLGAVLDQDYPAACLEILVVDGMSTDATRDIVQQMIDSRPDLPICLIDNPRQIVPTGMNLALKQAQGEIIVRVDGHCEIAPDYLSRCVAHLLAGEADGVGGPIETIGMTPISETIALAMSSRFGVGGSAFRTIKDRALYVDTVAFPAYTRAVIEQVGWYDEELVRNQDDEYNYRLRSMGYRVLLAPDVRSRYYSRGSVGKLWRQYYQYGMYKVRVMQKHPLQMRPRQFAPFLLVSALLGGGILAPFNRAMRGLWLLALAAYGAGNLLASLWTARQMGWGHLRFLPVVFATLHISYGLGFMRGLVRFRHRWHDRG